MADISDAIIQRLDQYLGTETAKKIFIAILIVGFVAMVGFAYTSLRPLIRDAASVLSGNEPAMANAIRVAMYLIIALLSGVVIFATLTLRGLRRSWSEQKKRDAELKELRRETLRAIRHNNEVTVTFNEGLTSFVSLIGEVADDFREISPDRADRIEGIAVRLQPFQIIDTTPFEKGLD